MFFGRKNKRLSGRLIASAKKGDKKAFGQIYDHFVKQIFRFVYFKTSSKELAEDLTQDIFLKALQSIGSFKGDGDFSSWLFAIARNLVADHYRYRKTTVRLGHVAESEVTDSSRGLDGKQLFVDFMMALSQLEDGEQEVIILHSIEGYDFNEIAMITNKSPNALRTLKHRALKKLKEIMKYDR